MAAITHHFAGREGEVLVVVAPLELTHDSAEQLRRLVDRHLPNRTAAAAILDMSHVGIISSIGIAALLQVQESCHDRKARMVLAGVTERQRQFLAMLKLEAKFEYAPSVDDAVVMLGA